MKVYLATVTWKLVTLRSNLLTVVCFLAFTDPSEHTVSFSAEKDAVVAKELTDAIAKIELVAFDIDANRTNILTVVNVVLRLT